MTLTSLTGNIRFKVAGQSAMPKWQQIALRDALANADSPPEALRFQCRIASDAYAAFSLVELDNGETLHIHPQARPQFGKNTAGHAFLTATLIYSGDGEAHTFRWVGDAVPVKMQEIAVKHDKGLAVKAVTIILSLDAAQIAPAWTAYGKKPAKDRDHKAEDATAAARKASGAIPLKRAKRTCARLTDSDLTHEGHLPLVTV
jgi:hypothetical protein